MAGSTGVRSYDKDVSKLVDVVRQSIAFKDGWSLLHCLRLILADSEAKVVRIKNRMDPRFDSACLGGYRNVNLNLQISTAESRDVCVDEHVCELQLELVPFAEIKSNQGHKRYIEYRNLRSE